MRGLFLTTAAVLTLFVTNVLLMGCSTSTRIKTSETGRVRTTLLRSAARYGFLAGPPTVDKPYVMFKFVKFDTYIQEKEKQNVTIEEREPKGLTKLVFLPLWLGIGVVSLGEVNLYETTESVAGKKTTWEKDFEQTHEKQTPVSGAKVIVKYDYAGEKACQTFITNAEGIVQKDLRGLAESVALDPQASKYVEFTVSTPAYRCEERPCEAQLRVDEKFFLRTYEKWSSEGHY